MSALPRHSQALFLLALLIYDVLMLLHVFTAQGELLIPLSQYDPIHPLLPMGDTTRPVLEMAHLRPVALVHAIGAMIPLLSGIVQISTPIRNQSLTLHRWNGRLFLVCTVGCAAIPGMWMSWGILHASAGLRLMIGSLGLLVVVASAMTWISVRAGRIEAHRMWAIRLYAYLHAVPLLARVIFWMVWAGWSHDRQELAILNGFVSAEHITFELIGWLTIAATIPAGEAFARLTMGGVER